MVSLQDSFAVLIRELFESKYRNQHTESLGKIELLQNLQRGSEAGFSFEPEILI